MTAGLVLLAAILAHDYAPTPQQAVLRHVFGVSPGLRIVRANVVGSYATVVARGGIMEGAELHGAILLQHFSFGWQPVEALTSGCLLKARVASAAQARLLMRGMPKPADDRCFGARTSDAGPRGDVEAVRSQMYGPLVPYVAVVGRFALGEWYGGGGGQTLFRRDGAGWHEIAGGGGQMGLLEMRRYAVPKTAWCAFGIAGAHCMHAS